MAQLSTKIKQYVNAEVDFLKDVLLQDDGQGAYIKEWNLDIPKPTQEQLDALEAQATTYENNEKLKQLEKLYMDPGTSSLKKFTIMV
jgi:hypothetical protein